MDLKKSELERFLDQLAHDARSGDRLPTIRALIQQFGVSQLVVQRAFKKLAAAGLIESHVGRGTYFFGPSQATTAQTAVAEPAVRTILLLRRSISIVRSRALIDGLQRRFTSSGHKVLEVTYADSEQALTVLKGLPNYDSCVIQSTFETIAVSLLAALLEKTDVLAVDGAALFGTEVDAVGTEWGEPLAEAISRLQRKGHRRIAYATTSHPFFASQLGLRRFDCLKNTVVGLELRSFIVPHLPDKGYQDALVRMIAESLNAGQLPFTGLVAWGIEDGARFRTQLLDIGVDIPSKLSVILLGRTDLVNEHADFFDIVGCRVFDQVEYLYRAVTERWAAPSIPYGIRMVPLASKVSQSVAEQPKAERRQLS